MTEMDYSLNEYIYIYLFYTSDLDRSNKYAFVYYNNKKIIKKK